MPSKLSRRLRAALLGTLAALVLGEIGARVYLKHFASERTFARFASVRDLTAATERRQHFTWHVNLGYSLTPNWKYQGNLHNSLGFRGREFTEEKPEGEYRIVCLGGSTTYGGAVVDFRQSYPALLQRYLRQQGHKEVRVINAGCSGWTSYESLFNLHLRVLDLEPDLLVIYHGINDLKTRLVWPPEHFRGDNPVRRIATKGVFMPPVYEHSALVRIVLISLGLTNSHFDLERQFAEEPSHAMWDRFANQLKQGTYPSGIFRETSVEKMLATNTTKYFERNLQTIINIADREGAEVMLTSFQHCPMLLAKNQYMLVALVDIYDDMSATMERLADQTSAEFFDFAAVMPRAGKYYSDHVHMTAEGNALKGQLFGEFIAATYLNPR